MGGAEMYIDAVGMHDFPASNQVQLEFIDEEYVNLGPIFNAPTLSGKSSPLSHIYMAIFTKWVVLFLFLWLPIF